MTIEEIRELIQLVTDTAIAELEVQRGENRVRIRRSMEIAPHQAVTVSALSGGSEPGSPRNEMPAAAPAKESEATVDTSLVYIKSPIVGTFYEASSPGTAPYVRNREHGAAGQRLLLIESMK